MANPLIERLKQQQAASGALPQSAIEGAQMAAAEMSVPERLLVGLGKGASNIVEGIGQLTGLSSAEQIARTQDDRRLFEAGLGDSLAAGIGEVAGEVSVAAPLALIPGGIAATTAGRIGASAGLGAAEGALGFVDEGGSRLANAAIGGLAGGAAGGLFEGAGRLANAARGRTANAEQQEILDLGKQHKVPVSGADVSTSMNVRRADVLSENIPVLGPVGFRLNQAEAAREAAEGLRDRLAIPDGDSVGNEIQRGLKTRTNRALRIADKKFDRVRAIAAKQNALVAPTKMMTEIDRILAEEKIVPSLEPSALSVISTLSKNKTAPFDRYMQQRTLLQRRVNKFFDSPDTRNEGRVLAGVVRALDEDMGAVATQHGGRLAKEWRSAQTFFRDTVIPQRAKLINDAAKKETPDVIFKQFLKGASQIDKPQLLYNALDSRGRQAVRFGIIDEAIQKATSTGRPGNPVFSPAKFAGELERLQGTTGVFFRGRELQEVQGITKLMRAIERAGQVAENPPTGARLVLPALGASFFDLGATAMSTLASAAGIRALTTTSAGRRLLLAANQAEIGSKQMDRIIRRYTALATSAAIPKPSNSQTTTRQ